jgi:hypothetical protein
LIIALAVLIAEIAVIGIPIAGALQHISEILATPGEAYALREWLTASSGEPAGSGRGHVRVMPGCAPADADAGDA